LDPKGKTIFVNQIIQPIAGYSPEELIGKNWWETFYPGELRGQVDRLASEFGKSRDVVQFRMSLQAKDGALKDILWTSYNIWDEQGNLVEINGVGQQIQAETQTGQKPSGPRGKGMDALGAYEKMAGIKTILLAMGDDLGNVFFWNDGAELITGYKREEVLGNGKIFEWMYPDPEYRKVVLQKSVEIIQHELRESLVTTIRTRDGKQRTVSWNSVELSGKDGKSMGNLVVGIDVTERKKLDEQERLTQKMESLTRLAAGIAHNFNNMLSIVQGYLELTLEEMDYGDPLRENLLEIADATERGAKLTNQLLSFSKHQVIEPISYDINKAIQDMSRIFKRILGDEVNLVINLGKEVPGIKADPAQIEQCLLNLVMNARDSMGSFGTLAITTSLVKLDYSYIQTHYLAKAGDYVLITVADTGKGMTPEVKDRIFEPFFSTKEGSMGLGLATVYGAIHQHDGHIAMDSEPDRGTTFNIYLPASTKPLEQPRHKEQKMDMPHGAESMLLVEDNAQLLALAARIMRRLGYTVFEANNGEEALMLMEKYPAPIHILVTDVIMPGMSGIDLAKRAAQLHPDLRILFITGHPLDEVADKSILAYGANVLVKPFPARTLAQKVREILDQK
jgi:two-component system, cell cycle sensor histidine kinase and response regulator CckA